MLPDDLAAAAELCTQLGYPASAADVRPRLETIADRATDTVLVAVDDGTVVGWIHAAARVTLESEPSVEIAGLVVDRAHRGRGLGRALLDAAEGWARETGCGLVRVRSRLAREAAHRFYERAGYERTKTQLVFEKRL